MLLMAFFPGSFVLTHVLRGHPDPRSRLPACCSCSASTGGSPASQRGRHGHPSEWAGARGRVRRRRVPRHPREHDTWASLAAPLLAPLGFLTFQGTWDTCAPASGCLVRVQTEAWDEGTSFGYTAVGDTSFEAFLHPLASPTDILTAVSVIALVAMVWCAWKVRLHPVLASYCAVVVGLMLVTQTVTARPRFLITAFPLIIAVAAWWPERQRASAGLAERAGDGDDRLDWATTGWDMTLVLGGAGIAVLTGLYAVFGAIP